MRELVILIFQPIYDTGLAGLGGVIALSVVLELIKRFFTGMANALTLMPSLLIPTVVGILACLFFVSSTDYKPSAEELAAGKKQGLVWGLCWPCFSMCSATLSTTSPGAIWQIPAPIRPQRSWAFGRPICCLFL